MRTRNWITQKARTKEEIEKTAEKNQKTITANKDIIVTEIIETIDFDKDGNKITKYEKKNHNISKQINETAKLLKIDQAKKLMELIGISEEEIN